MEFKEYKLKDIAEVQTGPFGSQLHKKDYVDKGTPIITVEHLGDNRIKHTNLPRVTESDKERLSKYILKTDDIVFSRVGSVDRRALIQKGEDGWLFSGRCLRVRVTSDGVNPTYLSYYFGTERFKEYIRNIAVGATMPSLNTKILKELTIILPEKPLQDRIASMLNSFTNKIQTNIIIAETLQELAQTLFKHWFFNFEFPDDDGEPYRSNGGKMVESELGLIPEGWEVGRLSELGDIVGGGTPSKKIEEYYTDQGVGWITPKDLSSDKSIFIEKGATDITEEALQKSSAKLLPENSVLFSSRAPIGYVAISGRPVSTNQGFKSIVPYAHVPSEFVFFLLKHLTPAIEANAGGSTFKEISGKGMKNINTVIPDSKVLTLYQESVHANFSYIKELEKENRNLISLRDILLPKLLSGEIELNEKIEEVENALV